MGSSSSSYSDIEKVKIFKRKKYTINKLTTCFCDAFVNFYNAEISSSFNPDLQLKDTESAIKSNLIELFAQLKGFKFVATLVLVFKKIESGDKTKFDNFYSSLEAETIINESDIDNFFQPIYTIIITNIQTSLAKDSGWIIDSDTDHTISIPKNNPLAGSSYIKLPKELDQLKKGLIVIQNIDNN